MNAHRNSIVTPRIARGGKAIYGAPLGILMLEARFPRIPGDMGNAHDLAVSRCSTASCAARAPKRWCCRARAACCRISSPPRTTRALGAEAITTNCGFLSLFQARSPAPVGVPVATSSLMQVPWVQATLPPGKRVGVVTVSGSTLTPAHLEAAGVPLDTPVVGTENGREFFRVLIKAE